MKKHVHAVLRILCIVCAWLFISETALAAPMGLDGVTFGMKPSEVEKRKENWIPTEEWVLAACSAYRYDSPTLFSKVGSTDEQKHYFFNENDELYSFYQYIRNPDAYDANQALLETEYGQPHSNDPTVFLLPMGEIELATTDWKDLAPGNPQIIRLNEWRIEQSDGSVIKIEHALFDGSEGYSFSPPIVELIGWQSFPADEWNAYRERMDGAQNVSVNDLSYENLELYRYHNET